MKKYSIISINSPAKINLFLKVINKREDGYHNIVSIVDIISIFDIITIRETDNNNIVVRDNKNILPEGMSNTVFKAAMILKEQYNIKKGADIFIEKNIPIGSGLGGPSSNAVSAIKGLVELWHIDAEEKGLYDIAKKVGADCPLFLYGKPCIMRGIGELISPVKLPKLSYVVIYPNRPISTKDVYENLKIVLTKNENDIKLSVNFNTVHDVVNVLHNDLEKAAITMFPHIIRIKEMMLQAGAMGSMMSGSGSSVFGIFEDNIKGENAIPVLRNLGKIFTAESIM